MSTIATHRNHSHPRVASPRRLVVRWDRVVALLVAIVVVAWSLGVMAGQSEADEPPADPVTVVVQPGDTLWDLARAHAPAGMATLEYVGAIEQANGVRAGLLLPGVALQLPQG